MSEEKQEIETNQEEPLTDAPADEQSLEQAEFIEFGTESLEAQEESADDQQAELDEFPSELDLPGEESEVDANDRLDTMEPDIVSVKRHESEAGLEWRQHSHDRQNRQDHPKIA